MADSKETLKDRLRNLVGLNRGLPVKTTPANTSGQSLISDEFWLNISTSSLVNKIEKMKEVITVVENEVLQDSVIRKLWVETKDLLHPSIPHEIRTFELHFVQSIIKGQYRRLGILRAVFFQALQEHTISEDAVAVVHTFELLSDKGKDVELFEQEVGQQVLKWLHTMKSSATLLSLLVNLIKFNSSYLDQEVVVKLLHFVCNLCSSPSPDEEKTFGLQVVDAVICYSSLPHESLYSVTVALCHTLNMKKFCTESWKLMRKLLGTHLGHSCVSTMCCILQNQNMSDWPLLRSAVFFIGMGLWGSVRVKSLKHTPQSVLPSFHRALQTKHFELAFEVTLTIQRLVRKFGHELQTATWDHVLDIVTSLLKLGNEYTIDKHASVGVSIKTGTHDILTFIEKLIESDGYSGPLERLYTITESSAKDRPTDSVLLLISYKQQAINPTKQNWLSNLLSLLGSFYTGDTRSAIRLKAIEVLESNIEECIELYEWELAADVVLKVFSDIDTEPDIKVKTKGIQLLVKTCLLSDSKSTDIFDLLRGVLNSGMSKKEISVVPTDVVELVSGVVKVFRQKLLSFPGAQSIDAFHLLILFLRRIYSLDSVYMHSEALVHSRCEAFELLLSLRANEQGQVGIKDAFVEDINFSPHVLCSIDGQSTCDKTDGYGYLPCGEILECVLMCLNVESHWTVLDSVLSALCGLLCNKFILTGPIGTSQATMNPCLALLDKLILVLCSLLTDSEVQQRNMSKASPNFSKADVQITVVSVLSCLACYHPWLDVGRQRQILRCLASGFTSRCAHRCIGSLTLCIVEMPKDTLLRVLPSILSRLSQMSATVNLSTAVLELQATLSQLPGLYSNFVEEQYRSIFAVALQYTNPSKFSRYVVSLAHYVIGTWFTKCRTSFRPDFVSYITRNLHNVNYLNTSTEDNNVEIVRNDLMETCIDTMARYTFSNCSSPPRRSPLAQFLFEGGPTATWLLGNKLITITTNKLEKRADQFNSSHKAVSEHFSSLCPNPTHSFLDKQASSEAPGKLQSSSLFSPTSYSRQRHKSGGAILRRSANLSSMEPWYESSFSAADLLYTTSNLGGDGEPNATSLKHMLTQGWVEIYIRRPSGDTAWSMRIQNPFYSTAENHNIEDVLNLQRFLKKLNVTEAQNKSTSDADEEYTSSTKRTVKYMDVINDTKIRSASNPERRTVELAFEEEGSNISKSSINSMPASMSTTPPLPSSPLMRHRSHTVSTSRGCAAEAAANTAKLAAERKKSEWISRRGMTGNNSSRPSSESFSAGHKNTVTEQTKKRLEYALHQHNSINSPCFAFLQLFQSAVCSESIHRPILLPTTPGIERSIQVLDMIPSCDTWATGVIYIGPGNGADGNAILSHENGSARYQEFVSGLGELICLPECNPASTYLGGLDTKGEDGNFAYVWKDDLSQMVFHVTTLMPTQPSDFASKKRHIGNDYVIIAYDDDSGRYVPGCVVQGQFRSVEIVITPLDNRTNYVRHVFHKEVVESTMGPSTGPWLISDEKLAIFVRQLALHANMAAFVSLGGKGYSAGEYSSKALARLKQIKRIRSRSLQEVARDDAATPTKATLRNSKAGAINDLEEFSYYVR